MASLLDRISGPKPPTGPIRSKSSSGRHSSPYTRNQGLPKGDSDSAWSHDLYESHNSLSARISGGPVPPKASLNNIAQKALKEATGAIRSDQLSIKGASQGNVVEVKGLAPGTTAEDVAAIFKRCGVITDQKLVEGGNNPRVRLHFKTVASATSAVSKFNDQPADGKVLKVTIVGSSSAGQSLASRFGKDGLGLIRQEGSVDVLMDTDDAPASKLRSDALLQSDRAHVLVAPPGADASEYVQGDSRGGRRGRGRGHQNGGRRGRGGRRGGNNSKMDTD
ncbi:hypothetical protein DFP72DRAFT_805481 [Ephemerocybe angulata]|uniref:RRM domain-containing protein n=1 Tax=Ephemerocybe angulata TaxID=980116 RepID=A0A8H6MDN2_9AGAR|nr:hypothetical protein DFP72DRAFT_805481 [Tulosesus angulatus]